MYYCHKCKSVFDGEPTRAVIFEEEVNLLRKTTRMTVCLECMKSIVSEFIEEEETE